MSIPKQCSSCIFNEKPIDQLALTFPKMEFAAEGAKQILLMPELGISPMLAYGFIANWEEFKNALQNYMEDKGDNFSLIAGGE